MGGTASRAGGHCFQCIAGPPLSGLSEPSGRPFRSNSLCTGAVCQQGCGGHHASAPPTLSPHFAGSAFALHAWLSCGAEIERARLENENEELSDRLETRIAVDRAKGILQRDLGITEDEAYRMMQRESRQRRKSMREIAEAILLSDELKKTRSGTEEKPVKHSVM